MRSIQRSKSPKMKNQKDEQEEVENVLFKLFKSQRKHVLNNVFKLTCGGSMMSVLCDPITQASKLYNITSANKSIQDNLQPVLHKILMERGTHAFEGVGIFNINHILIKNLSRRITFSIEDVVEQNVVMLRAILNDADKYNWEYQQLEKRIKNIFSYERSHNVVRVILTNYISNTALILDEMKHQRNNNNSLTASDYAKIY